MAWGKVDDNFAFHPKVLQAGNEAIGLWTRAMSYSCQQLTDGFIPVEAVAALGADASVASRLVQSGLWDEAEGGWAFHQWSQYQPSGADVKARRDQISAKRSEAGKKGMSTRWDNKTDNKPIANEYQTYNPEPEPEPEPNTTSKEVVLTRDNPNEKLFDHFWEIWPKRVGKADARKAWAKALKKTDAQEIISAATVYAASPFRPEMQFIPMPATWLNGERWSDDAPTGSAQVTKAQRNLSTVAYFDEVDRLAVEA
jgi:hypothetical protein